MKMDVCYWINRLSQERNLPYKCINTSVEATTLADSSFCSLLPQDRFISQNITSDDYLIVSIGGNDIALKPLLCTIANIVPLVCCTPGVCIKNGCACPPNTGLNCGCMGCGCLPDCLVGFLGCPLGLGYFVNLFKNHIESYIKKVLSSASARKQMPRKVLVCMIYYPSAPGEPSWADGALSALCYNQNPKKLQLLIKTMFELATKRIVIQGTEVRFLC
jgi:hypothetical protein